MSEDATTHEQALPEGVYCLPALPPEVDAAGTPVGEVGLLLQRTTDGRLVADIYSSPARLVTARGQLQTWIALRGGDLAELLDRAEVDEVVLDAGSPEAMHVGSDGTVTALKYHDA